jgi:hypothetical protein
MPAAAGDAGIDDAEQLARTARATTTSSRNESVSLKF